MNNLLQFVFVAFISLQIHAQQRTISGTISDENGIALPGVNVIIKGTSDGTQTNFDGFYSIKAKPGDLLVFSFIGYQIEEKEVNKNTSNLTFAMQVDSAVLEEVVVSSIGFEKELNRERNTQTNRVHSLQGKVAAVNINSNGKHINQTSQIVLRGNRSILGPQEAIIVIDGNISSAETLANLEPENIDIVNVIKGAGGKALYGAQGANGVVIVTTKDGNYILPNEVKQHILHPNTYDNSDSYEEIVENAFENVKTKPLSTFSIDVDKASYSNIRRMINNGQEVPANSVKIEEMVNYFDYDYPQPVDKHPFSINTEQIKTPWNTDTQLVRIGLQGKTYENDALPASNLTFLIDVSGSMNGTNRLPLLKSAFKLLVNQLREKDLVSIVVYAGAAGVVLEPTSGNKKDRIIAALDKLAAGGSTAGGQGIELAYSLAEKHFKKNGNNRVILATDGDFNVGASSDKDMEKLIEEKRKTGVFLSVLGFGYGNYKDSKLETLADKGNGNHAYIDTMQEAQKVFGKEFGGTLYTIAKDVKIQVEFNPAVVQAYRLIGYENRILADEDFIDDTKDAGELGSGHSVTALYEVIPVGVKSPYMKNISDLKYTKSENTLNFSDELFTVKFRYKKPDGEKSIEMVHVHENKVHKASTDMQFASAVALFGMQLRDSKYDNNGQITDVLVLAKQGRGIDNNGYRSEFLRLVNAYNSL
ncbi:VWA domain-containing protein [Bizionia argentinensis JUB59]|uniref:VWA domain-containing protein n=1 Tax=Bizionia argentinensis JUB59 TaxID=1046627 RepID=G2E9V1_9FLAO|nr:VWA domain-containing protein [Bizionia argentinensis]EGV45008.1 VWA domain-containing protein [Bizionia argentinensis JUB59]